MDQSITDTPTLGKKDPGEYFGLINRSVIYDIWGKASPLAIAIYVLIDSHTNGHGQHVKRETLLMFAPCSIRTLDRGIAELKEAGYLKVKRHLGSNYYELINPVRNNNQNREEVDKSVYLNSPNLSTSNRNKFRNKNKQTEHAPLEGAASVAVVVSEPTSLKDCNDQERSYVKAFAVSLETQVGGSLYPGSFKAETLRALLIALNQGYTAQEAAAMCSQYYHQEQQSRALKGLEPIRSATRWLIAILPSVLAGAEAEPINPQIPDYVPNEEICEADPNPEIWTAISRPIRVATPKERQELEARKKTNEGRHIKDLLAERGLV